MVALNRPALFEDVAKQIAGSVRLAETYLHTNQVGEAESFAIALAMDPGEKGNLEYRKLESCLHDHVSVMTLSRYPMACACLVHVEHQKFVRLGPDSDLGLWAIFAQRITRFGKDLQIAISLMRFRQTLERQRDEFQERIISGFWDSFKKVGEQARMAALRKHELLAVLRPSAMNYFQDEENEYFAKTFTNLSLSKAGELVHKRFLNDGYGGISPSAHTIKEWIDESVSATRGATSSGVSAAF